MKNLFFFLIFFNFLNSSEINYTNDEKINKLIDNLLIGKLVQNNKNKEENSNSVYDSSTESEEDRKACNGRGYDDGNPFPNGYYNGRKGTVFRYCQ